MTLHNSSTYRPTYKQVEQTITDYFGDTIGHIDIDMRGSRPVLEVEYEDFKPTHTVRTELERLLPGIEFEVLRRTYSDGIIAEAFHELAFKREVFHIDGQDCPTTLYDYFDCYLHPRHIHKVESREGTLIPAIDHDQEPTPIPN